MTTTDFPRFGGIPLHSGFGYGTASEGKSLQKGRPMAKSALGLCKLSHVTLCGESPSVQIPMQVNRSCSHPGGLHAERNMRCPKKGAGGFFVRLLGVLSLADSKSWGERATNRKFNHNAEFVSNLCEQSLKGLQPTLSY